jgi:transmembrane sensor
MESSLFYELLAKKLSGEANSDELQALEAHLKADHEARARAETFAGLYHQQPRIGHQDIPALDAAWARHQQRLKTAERESAELNTQTEAGRPYLSFFRRHRIAAAIFVTLLLTGAITFILFQERSNPALSDEWLSFEAGNRRIRLTLKDGTSVWLNRYSKIVYNRDFGRSKRDLTLTGEAFFDVKHNPVVPMVVHARTIDITVKGTAFNVMAYPTDRTVETSLIHGSVQLSTQSDRPMTILLKPNEKISIPVSEDPVKDSARVATTKPGTIYNKEILYSIHYLHEEQQSKLIPEIAWIEDKLVFQRESFEEVALKLERFYGLPVEIIDSSLSGKRFTGSFHRETLEEALKALQLTCAFEYRVTSQGVNIGTPTTQSR